MNILTFPLPKDALSNGGNWLSGSEKVLSIIFRFYLPLKIALPFVSTKLKPLHPSMFCAMSG